MNGYIIQADKSDAYWNGQSWWWQGRKYAKVYKTEAAAKTAMKLLAKKSFYWGDCVLANVVPA